MVAVEKTLKRSAIRTTANIAITQSYNDGNMKSTGLKAVSYPDTRMIIKGSTVKISIDTRIFYIQVERGSWMEGWYERIGYKFDKVNEEDKKWVWMKKDVKP